LLRVNRSMASSCDSVAISARREAWINDLSSWQPGASKRLRKDLAFARRANPALEIVDGCGDPATCFEFYSAVINQRGGRLRYTESYFKSLAQIAERTDRLQIFTALDAGQGIRGFVVLAVHGS